ncbi:MAG TPA: ROK family protein [Acidisphaera sp.]|nr:ROK family protein [Acidisphaera sp.]
MSRWRIGLDVGGTKIEIAALSPDGEIRHRERTPTPHDYHDALAAIVFLVKAAEAQIGGRATVGIGIPGVISPATGLVKNSSKIALNGHPFDRDISAALGRDVRVENDANCFALSEAADGAGAGCRTVFGVILGTGCGGGVVVDGKIVQGRNHIAGEWGHTPLPWMRLDETPGPACWCGKWGCLERFISGTGLAQDCDGPDATDASRIPARAAAGEKKAQAALRRHAERVARGLTPVVNLIDPDVIVLGGGLSNMDHLYAEMPALLRPLAFSDTVTTPVVKNMHGDSSGVRGAAWLWPLG